MLVTALVTPFRDDGSAIDRARVEQLLAFQLAQGADRVLLAGTTGEGAALDESERLALLDIALGVARPDQLMLSIGGGRLPDVLARGRAALDRGVDHLLLADCPYSGASSAALRTEWHGAVATALPPARLFPYAVPGRTGTEMLPDDLARLAADHDNVVGVKDATGRLARMGRVRELCGDDFVLLCGDDHMLRDAMIDPAVRADGACSFAANVAPGALASLMAAGRDGDAVGARDLHDALAPLFSLVCVTAEETLELADHTLAVPQRARNPLPIKTLLVELGVLAGGCRPPLGELGPRARARVRAVGRALLDHRAGVLAPLVAAFALDTAALSGDAGDLGAGDALRNRRDRVDSDLVGSRS